MTASIGNLSAQSSVRRWSDGEVTVTYVVDGAMWLSAGLFLSAIPPSYWDEHPEEIGADGLVAMSAGGLLVESGDTTLLIDAGLGDVRTDSAIGRNDCGAFLDTLASIDVDREDIDVFALTHLHVDHAGWAFVDDEHGRRVPTFPRAQYVVAEQELRPFHRGERPPRGHVIRSRSSNRWNTFRLCARWRTVTRSQRGSPPSSLPDTVPATRPT
ncbi:MBL fold metallo-hydrolase [Mycolicibacterium sp. 018/SC-01/001]|uniref:MBL fold metallo-hydrolase n=1 Tax=Mycolicibacterium sp. 018/SC-01/001 TaxID=2592069 RepID=UPI0021043EF4|nr:MBL fold metallo-hydrolase [Mycolicibacterium sp. 018/SC-01/001]